MAVARRFPTCTVDAVDPSIGMLGHGQKKIATAALADRIRPFLGVAERLPFQSALFDAVVIGFGIRNFTDRGAALAEIRRVLKPSGKLCILELSWPRNRVLSPFARLYIRRVIPLIGRALSSGLEYRYLADSIAAFPQPDEFVGELEQSGFIVRNNVSLMASTCHLYCAEKTDD